MARASVFPVNRKFPKENIKNEYSLEIPLPLQAVDILRKRSDCRQEEEMLEVFPLSKWNSFYAYGESFCVHCVRYGFDN